jgi:hypothetical protein
MNHMAIRIIRAVGAALRASRTPLSLALIAGCILAGAAWAIVKPEDFAGRWALRGGHCPGGACKALYDIGPCGEGWCGVEVEEGGKCGQTSMHLVAEKHWGGGGNASLSGEFRPAKDADPYAISAHIRILEGGRRYLDIYGNTGGKLQKWRRTYPIEMDLERVAEPECRAAPHTS